jgi:hypothetical protein
MTSVSIQVSAERRLAFCGCDHSLCSPVVICVLKSSLSFTTSRGCRWQGLDVPVMMVKRRGKVQITTTHNARYHNGLLIGFFKFSEIRAPGAATRELYSRLIFKRLVVCSLQKSRPTTALKQSSCRAAPEGASRSKSRLF